MTDSRRAEVTADDITTGCGRHHPQAVPWCWFCLRTVEDRAIAKEAERVE